MQFVILAGLVAYSGSCTRTSGARAAGEAATRNASPWGDLQWDEGAHAAEGAMVQVQYTLVSLCSGWATVPQSARPWHGVVCSLCSQHVDAQRELLEELYEDKLNNLKESLTDYYQEEIQVCSGQRNNIWKVGEDVGYLRWLESFRLLCFLWYNLIVSSTIFAACLPLYVAH